MSIQETIERKLHNQFENAQLIQVINESHQHNVPAGSESHFKVIIVDQIFNTQPLIQRHRFINQLLAQEISGTIHALAIHTYTPDEWRSKHAEPSSPKCLGGS